MLLMLYSSATNGAKDQNGARSLDDSLSPRLGFGVAGELVLGSICSTYRHEADISGQSITKNSTTMATEETVQLNEAHAPQ